MKKDLSKKLRFKKETIISLNEQSKVKGGMTFTCTPQEATKLSMCDFSCWVGTCLG